MKRRSTGRAVCLCLGGCQPRKPSPSVAALLPKLAASWRAATGERLSPDRFRCPLCLREVAAFCATLAHAPAATFGGAVVGLQCKKCNDFIGYEYEALAKEEAHSAQGFTTVKVGPAGVEPRVVARAEFAAKSEGNIGVTLEPAGRAKSHDAAIAHVMRQGGIRNMAFKTGARRGMGAVLAWAYLSWFERFGFSFALVRANRRLRSALLSRDLDDLRRMPVLFTSSPTARWPKGDPALVVVHNEGGEARAALGWRWPAAIAVLPIPADVSARVYDFIDDTVEHMGRVPTTVVPLDDLPPWTFGLVPGAPDPPPGNLVVLHENLRVVGTSRVQARQEADVTVTPHKPRTRPNKRREPAFDVPLLPAALTTANWSSVSAEQLRKVALDPSHVHPRHERAVARIASSPETRKKVLTRIGAELDECAAAHLADLWRFAVMQEPYDPGRDVGGSGQLMSALDFSLRGVPKRRRPRLVEASVRLRQDAAIDLASAHAYFERADESGYELFGPFYTASTMLLGLQLRMRRLRHEE